MLTSNTMSGGPILADRPCLRCYGPIPADEIRLGGQYRTWLCIECSHLWDEHAYGCALDVYMRYVLAEAKLHHAIRTVGPSEECVRECISCAAMLYAAAKRFVEGRNATTDATTAGV